MGERLAPITLHEANYEEVPLLVDIECAVSMQVYPHRDDELGINITEKDVDLFGWGSERIKRYIDWYMLNHDGVLWVARVGHALAGFAAGYSVEGGPSWLAKLYVLPQYQRQGVGSVLLEATEERLRPPIQISTTVYNQTAQDFYRKHSYVELCPRPAEQTTLPNGTVIPEILMIKQGSSTVVDGMEFGE